MVGGGETLGTPLFLSSQVGIFKGVFTRTVLPIYGSCVNIEDDSLK